MLAHQHKCVCSFGRFILAVLIIAVGAIGLMAQTPGTPGSAVHDPGVRGGTGPGGATPSPLPNLKPEEQAFFTAALGRFKEVDSVSGGISGENGVGLGPTFNGNSCAMCHAFPAIGGTSPLPNPQIGLAHLDNAANPVDLSGFLRIDGPVREVRFVKNPDGTPDGGVHGIFTIAGRVDATGCSLAQPNFPAQLSAGNMRFRIPTPVFGLGLVENTSNISLSNNLAKDPLVKLALGIAGRLNISGNDGTVTRFGWKAQNKSLIIFAGEAYNVEQGVSNEVFPNERSAVAGCVYNSSPEDGTNLIVSGASTSYASAYSSDTVNFAAFARLSAPPAPVLSTDLSLRASQLNGQFLFEQVIGCAECHSPTLTTDKTPFGNGAPVTYHPYSDIALHHMGTGLADDISQGAAGGDEFRTAPLWGIGQRIFFLHDGRTSDLLAAILAHGSSGSEASNVIQIFKALPDQTKQDILNFLRSL